MTLTLVNGPMSFERVATSIGHCEIWTFLIFCVYNGDEGDVISGGTKLKVRNGTRLIDIEVNTICLQRPKQSKKLFPVYTQKNYL